MMMKILEITGNTVDPDDEFENSDGNERITAPTGEQYFRIPGKPEVRPGIEAPPVTPEPGVDTVTAQLKANTEAAIKARDGVQNESDAVYFRVPND
jgi:hypothetical protein